MRGTAERSNDATGRRVAVWALRTAIALLAVWALGRLFGLERGFPLVAIVAFTPYVALLAVLVLAVALYARRWWEAAAAAIVLALLAVAVLPRAIPHQPTGPIADGVPYDVATVNARLGEADARFVVDLVRDGSVDLLSVQELTRAAAGRLRGAGIDELLPEQELSPASGSFGAGIYSRYPLERLPDVPGGASRQVHALSEVPGAGTVELVAVHPPPPTSSSADRWRAGLEALPPASASGPLMILAGDFNSGFDHHPFRDLAGTGYVDAAAARGRGLSPTWPAGRKFPPEVTIDHVLADDRAHVAAAEVVTVPDTDHRAVLARLTLPRRG